MVMSLFKKLVAAGVSRLIYPAREIRADARRLLQRAHFASSILLVLAFSARAQNAPHIGYVYPAGGRQASTFTVVIGGQFPSGITNFAVVMDGDWAHTKVVAYDRPLKPNEQQALKAELNKFQEKRKGGERLTGADLARLDEIKRLLTQFGRRPANPAISEFMTLQLTLATNIAPGDH
jgi:hypothetical protein